MDIAPMNKTTENLSLQIKQLSAELSTIERRLRLEPDPDPVVLDEFRHTVDSVRLTAWSVSELIRKHRSLKAPDAALEYLTVERLRRFEQMTKNLCNDLERRAITFESHGVQSLFDSIHILQQRLIKSFGEHHARQSKVKDAAS
jgi:hypothetical protein